MWNTRMGKSNRKYWLDRHLAYWSLHFNKYETKITLLFAIALIAFPTFLSILATSEESDMTLIYALGMGVSFWVMVICGFLLIRNSPRAEVTRRLRSIEGKFDTLIDEIRRDRNERNNKTKQ